MSETIQAACVADCKAVLGEGPIWVAAERALYWLDVKGRVVFRRDASGGLTRWEAPLRLTCLAPRANGGFVAGTDRGLAFVDLDEGRFEPFTDPEPDRPGNRFNDGKVDRAGRFWSGTMDDAEERKSGALYRLGADLGLDRIDDGYGVTNGPAFSPDGRLMYHTDSPSRTIFVFDLSPEGKAGNKRVFLRFGEGDGHPDGMTVDAEGCLWVAFWDGWCVRRLSPSAERLRTIHMPVQRPTSCAFGAPELDRLFVTSARVGLDEKALAMQPYAGGLFVLDVGVGGLAEVPFAG